MKKVLLDTSVYGYLYERNMVLDFIDSMLAGQPKIIIYGYRVVRNELRQIPKTKKIGKTQLRMLTLSLYDKFVGKHSLETADLVSALAEKYYVQLEGARSYKKIKDDLLIIACASYHNLDIICSQDEKTLKSKEFIRACRIVNNRNDLRTPEFMSVEELLKI